MATVTSLRTSAGSSPAWREPIRRLRRSGRGRRATFAELLRFGLVGCLNTAVDVLALNVLVWALRIQTTPLLLAANALAYGLGAVQSFVLNRHWTFRRRGPATLEEVRRFALTTLGGIALNDALLWVAGRALLPLTGPTPLWANLTKAFAIGGTVLLSYLGMRLWVFARRASPAHPTPAPRPRRSPRSIQPHPAALDITKGEATMEHDTDAMAPGEIPMDRDAGFDGGSDDPGFDGGASAEQAGPAGFLVIPDPDQPQGVPAEASGATARGGDIPRTPAPLSTGKPERTPWHPRALLAPHRLALAGIFLLSVAFNFWMLGQNGYGNLYYAATVRSMASNWHAFFFASLDPTGFVSVDKPPLGFWLQVASVKVFGFTPFAVFFPQALAGVLSVLLLYWLVRRHFGVAAGLISALVLAVSPISVVTNRNNTIDSTLLLALLLGAWATFRAIETDRLRWLALAGVFVALGFNIKMLEAYLVVPAFLLAYLLSSRRPWAQRLGSLALAGVLMVGLSLAWVVAVDAVPAALRPWVGSTQNNSELSLALGYNGVQRLTGGGGPGGGSGGGPGGPGGPGRGPGGFGPNSGGPSGGPGGAAPGASGVGFGFAGNLGTAYGPPGAGEGPLDGPGGAGGPAGAGGAAGAGGPAGAGGGQSGMFNTGNPGILRLFTPPLGGQIVWLLPLALIGLLALALDRRFRPKRSGDDRQQQSLILWGTWLVTMVVFFSVATFFHQYYLSQMAPAIAAMSGIGLVVTWRQFLQPGWRGWFLPFALGVTALEQLYIVASDPSWGAWLIPVLVLAALAAGVLAAIRLLPELTLRRSFGLAAVAVLMLGLLAAPTVWSAYPALANTAPDLPIAGLDSGGGPGGGPGGGAGGSSSTQVNTQLVTYLEANQGTATYLVAVPTSSESAPLIIATGKSVMTLGGFNGGDPILTTSALQSLIQAGTVRYFLLSGSGGAGGGPGAGGPGGASNSDLTAWVAASCTTVPASTYGGQSGATGTGGAGGPGRGPGGGASTLYDCA